MPHWWPRISGGTSNERRRALQQPGPDAKLLRPPLIGPCSKGAATGGGRWDRSDLGGEPLHPGRRDRVCFVRAEGGARWRVAGGRRVRFFLVWAAPQEWQRRASPTSGLTMRRWNVWVWTIRQGRPSKGIEQHPEPPKGCVYQLPSIFIYPFRILLRLRRLRSLNHLLGGSG